MWREGLRDVWSGVAETIPSVTAWESGERESDEERPCDDGLVVESATDGAEQTGGVSGGRTAEPGRRAVTDGGNAPEWAGEDPINFDSEDEFDGESLLEAVTSEPGDSLFAGESNIDAIRPDDAQSDGTDDGQEGPPPVGASLADSGAGESSSGEPEASDPGAVSSVGSDAGDGADAEGDTDAAGAPDAEEDRGAENDPDPGAGGPGANDSGSDDGALEDATDGLRQRLDAVESEHETVVSTVDGMESDVEGLHDEVRSLRSDMEKLVDLVKQTAPTRGGAASAAPSADDGEADASDTTGSDQKPGQGDEGDGQDGRSLADPRTETVGDRLREYQSGFGDESGAADAVGGTAQSTDDSSDDASDHDPAEGASGDDEANQQTEQAANAAATDAVSADLQSGAAPSGSEPARRDEPGGGSAGGEHDPSNDPFEFRKVLLPADEDGEPVVVGDDGQAYLDALPNGYAAEAAVIEWLDHLVAAADKETAARALAYYESIGWIAPSVQSELLGYLAGVGDVDDVPEPTGPPEGLELAHHRQSLEYVTALAAGEVSVDGV